MNIDLPADASKLVEVLIQSGEFETADQAVAEGVRLLMARKQLRDDIQQGVDELNAGEWIEGKQVFDEMRQRAQQLKVNDQGQ